MEECETKNVKRRHSLHTAVRNVRTQESKIDSARQQVLKEISIGEMKHDANSKRSSKKK